MKTQIATDKAPGAIGPYSQAIDTGSFVFISGQIPVNPATGEIPKGITAQTSQSLANVKAILAEAGLSVDNVVKTTVFLSDMANFVPMNEVTHRCSQLRSPPVLRLRSANFPSRCLWKSRSLPYADSVVLYRFRTL